MVDSLNAKTNGDAQHLQNDLVEAPKAAMPELPPLFRGIAVLCVYCLHNAWTCLTMLTMAADVHSAEALFHISENQIGFLGSVATFGILVFLPISMFCRWRRVLLWFGAILNIAPVFLRYIAAVQHSYSIALVAMLLQSFAFGVIAVWPALIARLFFRERRWAVVIAIAGLSNYVGGALGALLTPIMTGNSSAGLYSVLKLQAYAAVGLILLSGVFVWIPAVQEEAAAVPLQEEVRACIRLPALTQILAFGTAIGVSTALQCSTPMMLQDSGFSTNEAGVSNCVYQLSAAVVGVGLGGLVTQRMQLQRVIRWLHLIAPISAGLQLAVCVLTDSQGQSRLLFGVMLIVQALLGASLLGMLPFVTQELVYVAHPATENFITGFLNVVAMVVATVMNSLMPAIKGVPSASLIFALVLAESLCFTIIQRKQRRITVMQHSKQ